MRIKIEHIIFWILVAIIVATAIWILSGSPPLENSVPSLIIFVVASEILLWKALFSLDKKAEIGFVKAKNELQMIKLKIDNQFIELNNKLDNIRGLIINNRK